jgi:hypothetical protein
MPPVLVREYGVWKVLRPSETDPRFYYYNTKTKQTSWSKPEGFNDGSSTSSTNLTGSQKIASPQQTPSSPPPQRPPGSNNLMGSQSPPPASRGFEIPRPGQPAPLSSAPPPSAQQPKIPIVQPPPTAQGPKTNMVPAITQNLPGIAKPNNQSINIPPPSQQIPKPAINPGIQIPIFNLLQQLKVQ